MNYKNEALKLHKKLKGKFSIKNKSKIKDKTDLSLLYTPGVAEVCKEIMNDQEKLYDYTIKSNSVAVITDGSAVLGLGDIGPEAALPVMEGKAILFKEFANIDAYPLCIKRNNTKEYIQNIINLSYSLGGINLEDIKAPFCFEIEKSLKEKLNIPVFHDDQHGTAIVVLAGLINALKLVKKDMKDIKVVITGAGAAGYAVTKLLSAAGVNDLTVLDIDGVVYKNREGNDKYLNELAKISNKTKKGTLKESLIGADVFIGVSASNILDKKMIRTMNNKPIIFALANPDPEIDPKDAKDAGAYIVATGRSDYNNQINNVLAFPGIFRGVLDVGAKKISKNMKVKAAYAIAEIGKEDLKVEKIIPDVFNKRIAKEVALACAKEAIDSGLTRKKITFNEAKEKIINNLK